jgi:alkylated DNA repair dioxygenase AlkB
MSLRPKAKSLIGPVAKNAKGCKADYLKIRLDHGDLVVMHGPGIQKYYEVRTAFPSISHLHVHDLLALRRPPWQAPLCTHLSLC